MYKGQSAACLFPHSNSHLPSHLLARRHGTRWGGMPGVSPASTPQAQMVPKTQQAYSSLQPYTLCPNHNTPQIQSGPIYFYKPTNRVGLKSKYSWLLAQLYEQLFTPQTVHEVALTGAWDAWGHGACGVCSQAAGAQAQITYLSSAPKFIPAGTGSAAAAPKERGTDRPDVPSQSWCLSTVKTLCKGTEHAFPSQAANLSGVQQASRRQFDFSSSSTCSST